MSHQDCSCRISVTLVLLGALILGGAACRKSGGPATVREEPITGNSADPAVALLAQWSPTNRYFFRLEVTSSAQMPRRNSPQPVAQDTTVGQDFSLTVTNAADDGARRMELEILSVQLESSVGDNINLSYDSESRLETTEENATIARLKKLKGVKFAFKVSAKNKIIGSDGLRNLSDRLNAGNGRGGGPNLGGGPIGRLIDPKFFRELIEFNALPPDPIRIGDSWTVKQEVSGGAAGNIPVELTYTFKGWQMRNGRHCVRLDFGGSVKPSAPERNNRRGPGGGGGGGGGGGTIEGGNIIGTTWYDPEVAFPVETISDQSLTLKGTLGGRGGRRPGGTNAPVTTNTNANAPQTWTGTVKQHSSLKLSEMGAKEK